MRTILNDLFGPGTWGTGGNLVASALLTVPTIIVTHVRSYRQRKRQHEETRAVRRIMADLHVRVTGEAHPDAPGTESEAK